MNRNNKNSNVENSIQQDAYAILVQEKKNRRNKKMAMTLPVVAIVLFVLIVSIFSAPSTSENSTVNTRVISGRAETGSIDKKINGCGYLVEEKSVAINAPGNIKIEKYFVSDNESVNKGDLIAKADKASVMSSIGELQELIEKLDKELADAKDDEISSQIKSKVAGRIKKIYAVSGKSVIDTMYENGALMLVSLDGYMAVDFEADDSYMPGDRVQVVCNSNKYDGRVSEVNGNTVTVILTDNGPEFGENAEIYNSEGKLIGNGTLRINNMQKITGYTGSVASVKVSVNQKIKKGTVLYTMNDISYQARYDALLSKRNDLEKDMAELFRIYETGCIFADESGTVSNLNKDQLVSRASETGIADSKAGYSFMAMVPGTQEQCNPSFINIGAKIIGISGNSVNLLVSEGPVTINEYSDIAGINMDSYTFGSSIEFSESVIVFLYDGEGYTNGTISDLKENDKLICTFDEENNLIWIVCMHTASDSIDNENGDNTGSGDNGNTPSIPDYPNNPGWPNIPGYPNINYPDINYPNINYNGINISQLMNAANAQNAIYESAAEEAEQYSFETVELGSITPLNTVDINIMVDESDILKLRENMEAEITLDAFPGETYSGVITKISLDGTNLGGSSKYIVTVTMDRKANMLAGMNASVSLSIITKDNVLLIPEDALFEDGDSVFVYTEYSEKRNELLEPKKVKTGLSDGSHVEITEGLEENEEYFYKYADKILVKGQ